MSNNSQVPQFRPIIPALERLKQEMQEFTVNLGSTRQDLISIRRKEGRERREERRKGGRSGVKKERKQRNEYTTMSPKSFIFLLSPTVSTVPKLI